MIRGGYWGGAWGLSWAGAWGEAWLLLNQPYQELSLKGQAFVRSYLSSIHSVEVAEQIVSVAALNNISVIDAEVVVAAKQIDAEVVVAAKQFETRVESTRKSASNKVEKPNHVRQLERKSPQTLAAKNSQPSIVVNQRSDTALATTTQRTLLMRHNATAKQGSAYAADVSTHQFTTFTRG